MLPDFPKTKAFITTHIRERMEAILQSNLGIFSSAREHAIAEGTKVVLIRRDGSIGEIAPKLAEATANRSKEEFNVKTATLATEEQLLYELATKLAAIRCGRMIESIDEAVTACGNVISSKQSIEDQYLEALTKILMDFDNNGQPHLPTYFALSPQMQERLEVAVQNVLSSPEWRVRFESIVELKRQEWNDREATRNMAE